MSTSLLLLESSDSPTSSQATQDGSVSPLPPDTTKFLYSSLHRVDNLVRRHQMLKSDTNSNANLLAHLSSRLSLLAKSSLASSTRTVDYEHILCPLPRLSLADRMAISLKDNLDRAMREMDGALSEMELLYMSVEDILVALCQLVNTFGMHSELLRGVKHVQQVYLTLVNEIRARRDLWYQFTADEKRKSFMAASTLGDILLTPPVEWDVFAKQWIALGTEDKTKSGDEVDELAEAMGNWGKQEERDESMADSINWYQ